MKIEIEQPENRLFPDGLSDLLEQPFSIDCVEEVVNVGVGSGGKSSLEMVFYGPDCVQCSSVAPVGKGMSSKLWLKHWLEEVVQGCQYDAVFESNQ